MVVYHFLVISDHPSEGLKDQTSLVKHRCVGEAFHKQAPLGQHNVRRNGNMAATDLLLNKLKEELFLPLLSQYSHLCAAFSYIIINS